MPLVERQAAREMITIVKKRDFSRLLMKNELQRQVCLSVLQ